jgi:tyrosine aminotransferase
VEKILSVPGWVQSWTILFDKHHILEQIKRNMEVIATIYLHTNTFTQHALPKIFKEIGIFTADKMGIIQQNYHTITQKLENIHGLKALPAQGTIYLTVEIELEKFSNIPTDIDFVQKLRLEENVNVLPISIMGTGCNGFRLLTCALPPLYDSFFERLASFVGRHKK